MSCCATARTTRSVLTIAALALPSCTFAPPFTPTADVEEFATSYAAAFASGDPEQVVAHLSDDFVAMPPEQPPIVGREVVADQIRAEFAQFRVRDLAFVPVESHVGEDWAWVRGHSSGTMVRTGVRHLMPLEGKFLWILRRHDDGRWRLARDASSASRPHSHDASTPR